MTIKVGVGNFILANSRFVRYSAVEALAYLENIYGSVE